jgi:hypothetical protein
MKGVLSWLVVPVQEILSCLGCSSHPSTKYYTVFFIAHLFYFNSLHSPATRAGSRAGSPGSVSLILTLLRTFSASVVWFLSWLAPLIFLCPKAVIPISQLNQSKAQFNLFLAFLQPYRGKIWCSKLSSYMKSRRCLPIFLQISLFFISLSAYRFDHHISPRHERLVTCWINMWQVG